MASESSSTYEPLDLRNRQVRILCLLAGDWDSSVRCSLRTAYLDDNPQYEALSYVWGDQKVRGTIYLDGKVTTVTDNLYRALRRLRHRLDDRYLWVDALCINQNDDVEKSHQVNLMRVIYSKTSLALLWLGEFSPEPHGSQPTTDTDNRRLSWATAANAVELLSSMARDECCWPRDHEVTESQWEQIWALQALMKLPWWHRIWTVQEAILPKHAILIYGMMTIPLPALFLSYCHFSRHMKSGCCKFPAALEGFRHQCDELRTACIPSLSADCVVYSLNVFRARQASDLRDRVYGFLGLGSTLAADYTLSHLEVFERSTRSLIIETGGLEPLLRVAELERSPDLPTWVPDRGSEVSKEFTASEGLFVGCYTWFEAAGKSRAVTREPLSSSMLELQGLAVDQIREIGDRLVSSPDGGFVEGVSLWRDIMDRNGVPAIGQSYPRGKGTYHDAFWRTLAFDQDPNSSELIWPDIKDEAAIRRTLDPGSPLAPSCHNTRFFVTQSGLIGLTAYQDVQVGDGVYVLLGGKMPFILRKDKAEGPDGRALHRYVTHAYVHGIMDGEVMEEGRELEWITLV